MTWRFIHYWDVWGNPDEGFEVNDVATLGNVELDVKDSDSDEEILKKIAEALKDWFVPEKLLKAGLQFDNNVSDDYVWELDLAHEDGASEPFGRLERLK
jgi:hypothetical protein